MEKAIEDGYKRLLFPAVEREIRSNLTERAGEEAIKIFSLNLEALLMQPPIRVRRSWPWIQALELGVKLP